MNMNHPAKSWDESCSWLFCLVDEWVENATKQKNEEGIVSKKFNMLKSKKKGYFG